MTNKHLLRAVVYRKCYRKCTFKDIPGLIQLLLRIFFIYFKTF